MEKPYDMVLDDPDALVESTHSPSIRARSFWYGAVLGAGLDSLLWDSLDARN